MGPVIMAAAGVLLFIGSELHPRGSLDKDFKTLESGLLSDSSHWHDTHALLAAALVALAGGLVLLRRHPALATDRLSRRITAVTLIGVLLAECPRWSASRSAGRRDDA